VLNLNNTGLKVNNMKVLLVKALMGFILMIVVILVGTDLSHASTCRSRAVKHQFDVQQGYPHGRKGYIVDHICALAQGGKDSLKNMQYQTQVDSKEKDKIENTPYGKALFCTPKNSTRTRQVFNCK